MGFPLLLLVVACLGVAAVLARRGVELFASRLQRRQLVRPGWWAPPQEQERLNQILARNPSYDERTGLTSDPELARWWQDNQP